MTNTLSHPQADNSVKPEQISLSACQHIQNYLEKRNQKQLDKNDLNAVLRLSQHLRVFGLLSAVGYINQSNDQEGEVRKRTVPVWSCLLGQLILETPSPDRKKLMEAVQNMANNEPTKYMTCWRKAMILANHWNFWARAYAGED